MPRRRGQDGLSGGTLEDLERALLRLRRLRDARMRLGIMPSLRHSQMIGHLQVPARQLCEGVNALMQDMTISPTETMAGARRAKAREEA